MGSGKHGLIILPELGDHMTAEMSASRLPNLWEGVAPSELVASTNDCSGSLV